MATGDAPEREHLEAAVRKRTAKLERDLRRLQERLERARAGIHSLRRDLRSAHPELTTLARYDHGSVSPGVPGWSKRWSDAGRLRVLMFATIDAAGSLSRSAEAVNRCSPHAARCVVAVPHQYGYAHDLVVPRTLLGGGCLGQLLDGADVIQLKDEGGFLDGDNGLPADLLTSAGKPIIHMQYGSTARRHRSEAAYQTYVRSFEARVAITPDLCFEWASWELVPPPVDTDHLHYCWRDSPVVAHSPSKPGRKGTSMFLAATRDLPFEVDVIRAVGHAECLRRKSAAGLFFDQSSSSPAEVDGIDGAMGWYGNSAVEAAAFGIPAIAHLSAVALQNAARAALDLTRLPVINAPCGADALRATIERYYAMPHASAGSSPSRPAPGSS
jgi:hypothetical protein